MNAHIAGAPSLPNDIPYVFGKGERQESYFPIVYSNFFKGKSKLLAIDFNDASPMPPFDKAVDLLGDGSLWAIYTPGHTKGQNHVDIILNLKEDFYVI